MRTGASPPRKESSLKVHIVPNEKKKNTVPTKLADAELHFDDGPLAGMKLVGFSIWSRAGGQRNVNFPARQYVANGERRSFVLLRPISDTRMQEQIRDLVLAAYEDYEAAHQET